MGVEREAPTEAVLAERWGEGSVRMNLAYRMGYGFFRTLFATYFRWRVFNAERVPLRGPVILAANHVSFLDPPLVGSGVPRLVSMMARQSLFRFPLYGAILRSWRAVPVDPKGGSAAGLKAILERLEAGGAVLIFPEGTRSHDGRPLPARAGVGLAVVKSGAPVVPVRIWGAFEAFGRGKRFPRPRRLLVKYGQPLHFARERDEAARASKARLKGIYQEVSEAIMREIVALEPCEDKATFP